jgi:hypothetical protein
MCLVGALFVGAVAGPAAGKESGATKWAEVGGWHIGVDHTLADSCFATQSYQDGTALRIGFDMRSRTLYFAITNPGWRSIEAGKSYPLMLVLDNQTKYESEFFGLPWGDRIVLIAGDVAPDFVIDLGEAKDLRAYYQGSSVMHLSLRNAEAAMAELAGCQKEMLAKAAAATPSLAPAVPSRDSEVQRPITEVQFRQFMKPRMPRSVPRCGFGQC